ncbi:hypothetical protein BT96DRAFT_331199 [Gymnopus androsaceus JB14]|uniref:Major facilitator superfamily (MFS) profile domain-containing protein n=1 Tax=Gymnopus androsaceus JB14 TaxID=1447944 RepID=A0A6A4GYD0_9AGAR|nr:hypothetical protein BT96DRAFT_331199 [Gymnopus androsaceus JB14]
MCMVSSIQAKAGRSDSELALAIIKIADWLGWRWAFLIRTPLFVLFILLITFKLEYDTSGVGKNAVQVLKRIDYLGSITLLITVSSPTPMMCSLL